MTEIEHKLICDQKIPLHSLQCWKRYYTLMGRDKKVKMLEKD